MASKLAEMFSKTDAKSRILLVLGSVLGVTLLVVLGSRYFGHGTIGGKASVANAPSLQSVPGGELSPEYYRALMQANAQSAQQAQVSGTSAVATLVNAPGQEQVTAPTGQNCTVVCPGGEEAADVTQSINALVKSGALTQAQANQLLTMAKNNVPVEQYANYLNDLVKQGKLSPEQARRLLEIYSKQHANADVADSAQAMDSLIKSGRLPIDAANALLALQKQNVSAEEYSAALDRLVSEGKISPQVAQQLMAQYTQKRAEAAAAKGTLQLMDNLVKTGQLPADAANDLLALQNQNVTPEQYAAALDKLVKDGKITPQIAQQLLARYTQQKAQQDVARNSRLLMDNLVKSGKLPPEAASELLALQNQNVSPEEYKAALAKLVSEGKISADVAQQLMTQYAQQKALEGGAVSSQQFMDDLVKSGQLPAAVASDLLALQNQKVTADQYKSALDKLVSEGKISPQVAAQLLAQYTQQKSSGARMMADLVKSGQLPAAAASDLLALQAKGVSSAQYQAALDKLVSEGKITPQVAAQLMAQYNQQKAQGIGTMDSLVRSGQLPVEAANTLLALQSQNASSSDYRAALAKLVREGKITPQVAAQLMAQYTQQKVQEAVAKGAQELNDMVATGQITQAVASDLQKLQASNVPVNEYDAQLKRLVAEGKISQETANRLSAQYRAQRISMGPADLLHKLIIQAEKSAANNLSSASGDSKMSADAAKLLLDLQNRDVTVPAYGNAVNNLVRSKKVSTEIQRPLTLDYQTLQTLREEAKVLFDLQANNASLQQYSNELKSAVKRGIFTPEIASELYEEYRALVAPVVVTTGGALPSVAQGVAGSADFARLQQQAANAANATVNTGEAGTFAAAGAPGLAGAPGAAGFATPQEAAQFAAAQAQSEADAENARQQRIQALMASMSGQAQSLINSWAPPTMQYKAGAEATKKGASASATNTNQAGTNSGKGGKTMPSGPPLIKSGTILFAVLTTAVDSDYPDTPVMATIVSGNFKGAKLLGKLALATGQEKVSLNFNMMNMDSWITEKSVTAFAIDPDTARTVLASNVNYHYMVRYGTMFASSFLTGYASGITQAGSTFTGTTGVTATHAALSPASKIAVGLGQIGTAWGNAVASYINTPYTVKVNAGVGIGILFMADVPGG